MVDVICPGCNERYHQINRNFDPNISANGTMFVLKEPYASYGWTAFPKDECVCYDGLHCPGCEGTYCDAAGFVLLDCDMLWFVTKFNEAKALIRNEKDIPVNAEMDRLMTEYDPDFQPINLADPVEYASEQVGCAFELPAEPVIEPPPEEPKLSVKENDALDELPSVGQIASDLARRNISAKIKRKENKGKPKKPTADEINAGLPVKYHCKHCNKGFKHRKTKTMHTKICPVNVQKKQEYRKKRYAEQQAREAKA